MGLGDVLVRAWKDGLCAEITVRAEEREISLKLTEAPENMPCGRTDLQIRAPKDGATPWPVPDAAQKAVGRTRLKAADAAREKRLSTFREDAARAAERYPGEADIFLRARGNVAGLKEFLDGEDWKQERRELLRSLELYFRVFYLGLDPEDGGKEQQ